MNTATGQASLYTNTTGSFNTATGTYSLLNNTANNNTAHGFATLSQNSSGVDNTANGYGALNNNTTGSNNSSLGSEALISNTTGSNNNALGGQALQNNTTGHTNTGIGVWALHQNISGNFNTSVGDFSMESNTTGGQNTAIGVDALIENTTGANNTANGVGGLRNNTTGANNTASGLNAGQANTTGSNNTLIGSGANVSIGNLTNATAIGADAQVCASDALILGNNANVGIGICAPQQKLHIDNGAIQVSGANAQGGPMILFGGGPSDPTAINGRWGIEYEPGAGGLNFWRPFPNPNGFENYLLFLKNDGKIGIHTSTPAATLDVCGTTKLGCGGTPFNTILRSNSCSMNITGTYATHISFTCFVYGAVPGASVIVTPSTNVNASGVPIIIASSIVPANDQIKITFVGTNFTLPPMSFAITVIQ